MSDDQILSQINSSEQLKKLTLPQLDKLAAEIREMIIETVSNNGGHLAPSLGTVDLTLALYSVFNPAKDKIIWDVGHQAYAHKILTGRRDVFHTLRTKGGITGFPKREESSCDAFGVGHASTSISAALGMAVARDLRNEDHNVIAIIGDGAMTGGESFEGLNSAGDSGRNLIVIVNDNEMSIDKNVGALSEYLSQIKVHPQYSKTMRDVEELLKSIPHIGGQVYKTVEVIKNGVSAALTPGAFFEEIGFNYYGPLDGHNIQMMQQVFRQIKEEKGPILVHLRTTKGKGFQPAENKPSTFHGIGRFAADTGLIEKDPDAPSSYTEVFGNTLVQLAKNNEDITAITAAMPAGTGLKKFALEIPDRFFDVGIAEEHAVTLAAGMAAAGLHPVVAIYSTFAQRAYDQLIHDVCLQKLPVTLCLDRGGLVGADGPTHHGVFDYSYTRHIPGMVVMSPKDENELRHMLHTAIKLNGPASIRYPRGAGLGVELEDEIHSLDVGKAELLSEDGNDVAVLAIGSMVKNSSEAMNLLAESGIKGMMVNMRFVKPLDGEMIAKAASSCHYIVTVEENVLEGGFGSAVLEHINDNGIDAKVLRIGLPDSFVEQGSTRQLYEICGLLPEQIAARIKGFLEGQTGDNNG